MQDHHNLDVWRRALRKISDSEHRSLKTQAKRAAESIVFNIIEGCHARTNKEFARFLDISIKSSGELEGQLELARDYEPLPRTTCKPLCDETIEIRCTACGGESSNAMHRMARRSRHHRAKSLVTRN